MGRLAIWLVKAYRLALSPLLAPRCRFQPSCSDYTIEALEKYGFFKGSQLASKRIARCRPVGDSGYDPVP